MIILPAIDIINGKPVRLTKGDYGKIEVVADDYLKTAEKFEKSGAEWVHMVDLDGAKSGVPVNDNAIINVAKNTNLKVEVGGGIRTFESIEYYIENGIRRVILGSIALKEKNLVAFAVKQYGDKIAVGIDSDGEMVKAEGWTEKSDINYIELAKEMEQIGVRCVIFTDISKDGMLSGVNIGQIKKLSENVSMDIVASGGVKDIDDIKACKSLNLYGVIAGRSLYRGTLDLKSAIELAKS
ncbi:MAG: 1-(5-phosphoribosyl)-5-[(5-phosphoribosylamino)methylideneamino]imidazole-4-carboxamide isomerase [Ruminococcus sp.]|jgi:phosphoribosylformimino-5-aminoimidazole carboxamide ribotide isomerase|nr:1-(5-phosphoribosyl)-5-[(5-phosphoribosylamino)methylideneamino]imidazole-4-carboxamide isomerase [Ruminococcus sp.]